MLSTTIFFDWVGLNAQTHDGTARPIVARRDNSSGAASCFKPLSPHITIYESTLHHTHQSTHLPKLDSLERPSADPHKQLGIPATEGCVPQDFQQIQVADLCSCSTKMTVSTRSIFSFLTKERVTQTCERLFDAELN